MGTYASPDGTLSIVKATDDQVKNGTNLYKPIVPSNQHNAVFYGLAKLAGDTSQASSSNEVGVYTSDAQSAIRTMIGAGTGSYSKPSGGIPGTDLADSYIIEPSSDGTAGQVLMTDGAGGRSWTTVSGGSGGGTSDYTALTNKPSINNVTLSGNKSLSDLGIPTKTSDLTNDAQYIAAGFVDGGLVLTTSTLFAEEASF